MCVFMHASVQTLHAGSNINTNKLQLYGTFDDCGPISSCKNDPKCAVKLLKQYRAMKSFEGSWQWPRVRATCQSNICHVTIEMSINDWPNKTSISKG